MPKKTLIAVLTVLAGALAAAPAGAATVCPPGVTDATYCAVGNESGLTSKEHSTTTSNNKTVSYTVHCAKSGGCSGKLCFESATGVIYGCTNYSLKNGETATLIVKLNSAGRKALEKTGKLKVTVVSVTGNVRSVIGHLTIKGHKKAKKKAKPTHNTHATTKPGFTG
jgi:hypothetical protein